jgi:hypothetical protein
MKVGPTFIDQHHPAEQAGVIGLDDLRHQRQHVGQGCTGRDELKNAVLPCEKSHLLNAMGAAGMLRIRCDVRCRASEYSFQGHAGRGLTGRAAIVQGEV